MREKYGAIEQKILLLLVTGGVLLLNPQSKHSWKLIKAIQELNLKIDSFASTTPEISSSFIDNVWNAILAKFADWGVAVSQAFTRVANLVVGTVRVEDKLCVDEVCVSKDQLKALLVQVGATTPPPSPLPEGEGEDEPISPTILIQGNNPANIEVGATYVDLGVIARDSNGLDLSVRYFVNGGQVSQISLDPATSTSYTIDYSAMDNNNLTATSTRVVNVGVPITPPPSPFPEGEGEDEPIPPLGGGTEGGVGTTTPPVVETPAETATTPDVATTTPII